MSNSGNGGEPSMEEILASIRALVSQDTVQLAAQPAAPPQSAPQQRGAPAPSSEPAPSLTQAHDKPSPAAGNRSELPHSTPFGAPASPARIDEDDLADLLDEPLPPVEQPVTAPGVTPPLSADWSTGASGPKSDRAAEADSPAPAPMAFDFGAMVPSRDPAPAPNSSGGSLPPLSHTPATARPMASPGATLADGNLSAGWPQPSRGGKDAGGLAAPERAGPSPAAEAAPPSAPAAKSPANGAEHPAGKSLDKPVTEAAEPAPGSSAAPQSALNKFFSAPVTSPAASSLSRPLVARPEANASTALAQPAADKNSGEAAIPAPVREARPSSAPSFLTRVPGVAQVPAKESAAAYPSIEPVLKAFGKPDTMADRPVPSSAPAPALESVNAPEKASRANSSSSTAAPASTPKASEDNDGTQDSLGGRTLEDAVMHLLRPMLREWLDDNLPRIVEDAVRREIAEAIESKMGQVPKL